MKSLEIFFEITLVYDKSDQLTSVYDSYNCEIASSKIDSIKLKNAHNNYNASNETKFDLNNENGNYFVYC